MSTFAVFGMTEHFAREEARKKTPTNVGKTQLTEAQWLEAVERRVEQVMAGARVAQLSALYDAPPQFASSSSHCCASRERHETSRSGPG